jgi:hypothetical protein
MFYTFTVLAIIIAAACFSRHTATNNPKHVITMNQEADKAVPVHRANVNLTEKDIERFWTKVNKNGPTPDQSNPHYQGLGACWQWMAGASKNYGMFWVDESDRLAHRISFLIHHGHLPKNGNACHHCDNPKCVNPSHLFDGTDNDNIQDKVSKGRCPSGENTWHKRCPERIARGDRNGSRTRPERIRRGDNHPARLHPERMARGDKNGSRLYPERLKRGDDHPLRKNPEKAARGEGSACSKFTSEQVLQIRLEHAQGGTFRGLGRKYNVAKSSIARIVKRITWTHI